jgi:hypothetical protein
MTRTRRALTITFAAALLAVTGCAASTDTSGAAGLDFVPADVLEGTWEGQLSVIRSNGPDVITHPVLQLEFTTVDEGLFQYDRLVEIADGTTYTWTDGLGSISPEGRIQTTEPGEAWLMTGYLADDNTLIVQMSEFGETGQEVTVDSSTFAGIATLTKQ